MSTEAEEFEAAVEDVKAFIRCGGAFTWEQWKGADVKDKAIIIEAGEQLDAERMAMIGIALSGVGGAAKVFSRVDNGDSHVRQGMLEAVARAVTR